MFLSDILAVKQSDGIGEDNFGKGFTECASEVTKFLKNMPDIHPNLQARLLEHLVRYKDIDQTQSSSNSTAGNSIIYVPPATQTTTKVQQLPIATTIFANSDNIVQCMEQVPDAALQYANISTSSNSETHHVLHKKQHVTCTTGNQSSNAFGNFQNITDRVTPQLNSIQKLNLTSNSLQIGNIGNMISGFQIIPTRLESGQTAYIIPTNIVANTCIPNYIVPVLPSTCINPASRQIHQQPETSRTSSTSPETSRTSSTSCVTKTQNNIGTKYTLSRPSELITKDSTNRLNINIDGNFTPTLGYLINNSTTTNEENGHTSRDSHENSHTSRDLHDNCHTSRDLHENSHTSRDLHDPVDQHIQNGPLEDNVWRPW